MTHFHFDKARLRTPEYCEPGFNDGITRVAASSVPGAGYGLFAEIHLARGKPLYEYTGRSVTLEYADKYPNAYMFNSPLSGVVDASQDICSPAKFVNTKGRILGKGNNCQFMTHEDRIFLFTSAAIAQGAELFTPYGKQAVQWPMTFLGNACKDKFGFARWEVLIA